MAIYHNIDQYSDKWDEVRRGIVTASQMHRIITPLGKEGKAWKKYAHVLIAEKILKRRVDSSITASPAMEYGKEMEPEAMRDYEIMNDVETKQIGFVTTDDGSVGASPDRLVGDDGLVEFKSVYPQTMIEYLITGNPEIEYKPQLQCQLWVTGRAWNDIYPYNPEFPRMTLRTEPDMVFIRCMEELVGRFNEYMQNAIIEIAYNMKELRVSPDSITKLLDKTNTERPRIGV